MRLLRYQSLGMLAKKAVNSARSPAKSVRLKQAIELTRLARRF